MPLAASAPAGLLLAALHDGRAELNVGDRRLGGDDLAGAAGSVAAQVAGSRLVAVATADPLATLVAVAGVLAAGAAAVPLAPAMAPAERVHVLQDCKPDVILEGVDLTARSWLPGSDLIDEGLALVLYTSGSTGRPKGVTLSRRAIAFDLDGLARAWAWGPDDVLTHALPLSHVHGMVFGGIGPLRLGSPLVYNPLTLHPVERATMYFAVPSMWASLTSGQLRDLTGARMLVTGAAPLPRRLFDEIAALSGHRMVDRYAMTETLASTAPRIGDLRVHGLLGPPLPGVEVQLRDVGIAEGVGEVHVRGPNLFSGYLGQPSALDGDGWFSTGDLGQWDSGALRLVGRRSTDLIKTGGYRVGAGEVEEALLSHPCVIEAAVAGVPDDLLGERISAWVVLSEPVAISVLIDHLVPLLPAYKRPQDIHVIDGLPRSHLGKVQKKLLQPAVAGSMS
jgi:acyl-CoA synthetase (AMP-forming)/AMP-acid ligase II